MSSHRPGKLICIGLNYVDHARESGLAIPQEPLCFSKWPSALVGDGDHIVLPAASTQVDYEAELAVVIGSRALNVSVDDALSYVSGYACFNDISARDVQARDGQWTRAKSFDTFAPLGPVIDASLIENPQVLGIRCKVNGETVQDGTTADMIFTVAEVIAHVSKGITLEPGDIIATGTPAGVGLAKQPPRFLKSGDVVTVEIDRIGSITNHIR